MRKKIQVISPHFDDAVLSCGQHILDWQAAGHDVEVITVFTEFAADVLSADSASFVAECGMPSLSAFRKLRENEDKLAMKRLGVKKYQWLGFTDGGFREEQGRPVYMTHDQLFSGKILDSDAWKDRLSARLQKVIDSSSRVILPLGIGRHADHLVVKEAVGRICHPNRCGWYVDIPYIFQAHHWQASAMQYLLSRRASWKWSSEEKLRVVGAYAAQVPILFPVGLWEYPECVVSRADPLKQE